MSALYGNKGKSIYSDNTGAGLGRLSFTVSQVGLGHKDDPKDIDCVARPLIKASILEFFRIWLIAGNALYIYSASSSSSPSTNAAFVVPCHQMLNIYPGQANSSRSHHRIRRLSAILMHGRS